MEMSNNAITLSELDLLYMIKQYNFQINELAQFPSSVVILKDSQTDIKGSDKLNKLSKAEVDLLQKAIYNITSPTKIIRAHFTIGEKSIVRSLFSLDSGDKIVRTSKVGDNRHIEFLDADDFKTVLKQYTGSTNIAKLPLSVQLSSQALLVLLAVIDQIKHIRLYSTLTKTLSLEMFNEGHILDRLNEAGQDDFNWIILFLDKVFPLKIAGSLTEKNILTSFLELETKGFIEKDDENYYSFSQNGSIILEAVLENVSKIVAGISEQVDDKKIGHEVLLFVRSVNHLILFDFSGQDGAMAFLSHDDFDTMIKGMLRKTENIKAVPMPKVEPAKSICPSCKQPVEPGQKFCERCGHKLIVDQSLKCPSCKKELEPGSKFCDNCGAKVK